MLTLATLINRGHRLFIIFMNILKIIQLLSILQETSFHHLMSTVKDLNVTAFIRSLSNV